MGKTALLACIAVLVQVHLDLSQAAPQVQITQKTTYKFKIDHALDMAYASDAQRDALLQQVFNLWKTVLASYKTSNLKSKFLQQADSVDAGHHIVQYRISGDSAVEVRLQDVTTDFENQLSGSGIAGVATLASLQSGSGGVIQGPAQPTQWTVDISLILTGTTVNANDMSQKIFSLWQQTFGSNDFLNQQITTLSNTRTSNGQSVTYRITGSSQASVDISSMLATFLTSLQQANLVGVDLSPLLSQVNSGGTSSGSIQGNTAGNGFTVNNQQIQISASSDSQLNQMLQQILSVWKTTLSQYQISNVQINVISKTRLPNGQGYQVVYTITGQSQSPVDVQQVSTQFQSSIQSANLNGITLVPSGGSGLIVAQPDTGMITNDDNSGANLTPFTIDSQQLQLTYNNKNALNNLLQQILNLWRNILGQYQISNVDIKTISTTPIGNNVYKVVYKIVGQAANPINNQDASSQFQSQLTSNAINGVSWITSNTGNKVNNLVNNGPIGIGGGLNGLIGNGGSMSQGQSMSMNQGQSSGGNGMKQNQNMGGGTSWSLFGGNTNGQSNNNGGNNNGNANGQTNSGNWGGNTDNSGAGASFQVDSSALLTYTSASQRDALLQRLLDLFKNTFASQQLTSMSIVLIREAAGQGNSKQVFYRITGQSGQGVVDVPSTIDQFNQAISNSHISNVAVNTLSGVTGNQGNQGTDNSWTNNQDNSGAGASFQVDSSSLLTYTTPSQRDALLQRLLDLFKTTFGSQQLSSMTIVLIREAAGQGNAKQVFYRITGQSGQGVLDVPSTTDQFNQAISNSHITNIAVNTLNGVTNNQGNQGTDNSWTNNQDNSGGGASFQVDSSSLLTYTTSSQRDALLQRLLDLFKTTFGSLQLTSMSIVFIREAAGQGNAKQVFYRITGQSGQGVLDVPSTTDQFNQAIANAHIGNIAVNSLIGAASNTGGKIIGTITGNNNAGAAVPSTLEDSVIASYTSQSQRDAYLQQLLALFKTTFSSSSFNNVKIVFLRDAGAANGAHQLYYRISWSSSQAVDNGDIKNQFQSAISNANLAGISLPSAGGSTTGSFPVDFFDDTLALTYTSNSQRDQLLQQILAQWKTVLSQYQIGNLQIQFSSVGSSLPNGAKIVKYHITGSSSTQFSYNDVVSAFQQAIKNANINGVQLASDAQSQTSGNSGSGSFPISITRNDLALTYTTSLQRDNLLNQILSLWKTVFSQYQASNLQIKLVSEGNNGAAGARTVTYVITGSAGVQFDVNALIQQFLDALQGSPIAGVSLAQAAAQQVVSNVGAVLGGGGGPFSIPGSLKLTYKNDQQRDTFLDQVLVMWRNSVWPYQVSNVQIKRTGVTGVAPTRVVSYVITGTSAMPIDLAAATANFQDTLSQAHLTGIQYA